MNDRKQSQSGETGRSTAEIESRRATLLRMEGQQEALRLVSASEAFTSGDVPRLAGEITRLAARAVGVERANVWLFNEEETELRCIDSFEASGGRHSAGMVLAEAHYANEFAALREASYVAAGDALTDPRTSGYVETYLRPLRITSMLDALIQFSDRRLGLLCLEHVDVKHEWHKDEISFACDLADKMALALLNRSRLDALDRLAASEARYRSILEASPDAVAITDLGGRILIVAPMTLRMFGAKQNEEVLGRSVLDFVAPEDRDRASSNIALRLQGKGAALAEYRGMRLDGGRFDVEVNAALIRDADGRPAEIVTTVRDVTTRKQAEAALALSLREKEGLLKETHHRVKNNLALITSLMRLTAGRSREPETRGVLKEMQDRIHSVLLLNETLYKTASYTRVKLADYLGQISAHVFRAQNANTGDVRLVLEVEPVEVATAQAIPCGLIVNELLTNSLKHGFPTGRAGEVRVGLHRRAGDVQIRVSDDGVGLPANFDATRSESLGLQLISDLSRQLRGELAVGPASTFTITFPSRLHETGIIPEPPTA